MQTHEEGVGEADCVERQRRAATSRKIFLRARGSMPMRTILAMVTGSAAHAKKERDVDGEKRLRCGECALCRMDR